MRLDSTSDLGIASGCFQSINSEFSYVLKITTVRDGLIRTYRILMIGMGEGFSWLVISVEFRILWHYGGLK